MAPLMDMVGGGVTPMMVEQAAHVQSSAQANSISLAGHLDAAASPWSGPPTDSARSQRAEPVIQYELD
jgi:hypothetical protein